MQSLETVTGAILAGGFGTRLQSVVSDRPKVLAEVRGRPFLGYLLDQLADAGVRTVILCTGYLGEQVREAFSDSYRGLRLIYSQEDSPLGTGGAIRRAMPHLESDSILVLNGDSYCQTDLKGLWAYHSRTSAEATIQLVTVPNTERFGRVEIDRDGCIVRFEEKRSGAGPGLINAGIYLINRRMIKSMPKDKPVSLERDMFPVWIGRGLYGYRSEGRFLDIGTPASYSDAERFFGERA